MAQLTDAAEGPWAAGPSTLSVHAGLSAAEDLLRARRVELDALNVFPVPDGDTGANVVATIAAAATAAAAHLDDGGDPAIVGPVAAEGAVRDARGNSGVLLAQVLRALLDVPGDLLAPGLADRLARADVLVRAAVADPVEGSLLTAATEAATGAADAAGAGALVALRAGRDAAHRAVAASPGLNPVLARAGVVDAGARAFALVLEALLAVATGAPPSPPPVDVPDHGPVGAGCSDEGGRYEVMYLLEVQSGGADELADGVRHALEAVGDSVVVVPGDAVVSVHVHTDEIGAALEAGGAEGLAAATRPTAVRVEDLRAATARVAGREHRAPRLLVGAAVPAIRRHALAAGATVLDLDDAAITDAELAAAIVAAAAEGATRDVVLLPGRADVLAVAPGAASAVRRRTSLEVTVVDADTQAAVVAALAVVDPVWPEVASIAASSTAVRARTVRGDGPDGDGSLPGAAVGALRDLLAATALETALEVDGSEDGVAAGLCVVLLGVDLDATTRAAIIAEVEEGIDDLELEVLEEAALGRTVVVAVE